MRKRGRVQKKYRSRSSLSVTMQNSTNEKTKLKPDYIRVETPSVPVKSRSNESINDSLDCTLEFLLLGTSKVGCNDASPRTNTRLPKLKLNLDIPESDDTDYVEGEKSNDSRETDGCNNLKDLEKTLSVEQVFEIENEASTGSTLKDSDLTKCASLNLKTNSDLIDIPRKELTSLSGYFQIPSSTFNLPESVQAGSLNYVFASGAIQSSSEIGNADLNNPGCHDSNQLVKINSSFGDDCLLTEKKCERSFSRERYIKKLSSTNPQVALDIGQDSSWEFNPENIELPAVSDLDSKITETESPITVLNNASDVPFLSPDKKSYVHLKTLKNAFIKIRRFSSRLAEKCIFWLKKGCKGIKNLLSVIITSNRSSLINDELMQVISLVTCENERILSGLSEQISSLSLKLIEVRDSSEANLQILKSEMNKVEAANIQLTETNVKLVKEFKILQEKMQEIKSASLFELNAITKNSFLAIPPPAPPGILVSGPPPLPPPPPPPPPPLPAMLLTSIPNCSIIPKIKLNDDTSAKKLSTPLTSRPAITVEDLLKVTLKKAPQNLKDNRRNTIPGPRGPVISLDMLRNVKLKSARRRSLDQHKSPRSASRMMRNRSQSNLNLSPRAENSLSRLLKPDCNKRVLKKTHSVSSNSENDLSSDTPPAKLVVASCKSKN